MPASVKEPNFPNRLIIKHDDVGTYVDVNSQRDYFLTTALVDGVTSTTSGGSTAPIGSTARTSHATGKGSRFVAGASTWALQGGGGGGGSVTWAVPTGAVDGVNDTYTFDSPPKAIYRNGVEQHEFGTVVGNTFVYNAESIPATGFMGGLI